MKKYLGLLLIAAMVLLVLPITPNGPLVSLLFPSLMQPQCQTIPLDQSTQPVKYQVRSDQQFNSILSVTASNIGSLPIVSISSIQSFKQYKDFTDNMNDGLKILNDKLHFTIPILQGTQEEYQEVSKTITQYVTPICAYNDMVYSARHLNVSDPNSINEFYIKIGIFSMELALIATAAYATPSYLLVGNLYRFSGLQIYAVSCPSCISTILSNAHWFIRTSFVEETVVIINTALDGINKELTR